MNLPFSILTLLSLSTVVNGLLWILWSHPNGNNIAGFKDQRTDGEQQQTQAIGQRRFEDDMGEDAEGDDLFDEEEQKGVYGFKRGGGRRRTPRPKGTRRTRPTRPYTPFATKRPGGGSRTKATTRRPPVTQPTKYPTPLPTLPLNINPDAPVKMPNKYQRMLNKTTGSISRVFQGANGQQIQETLTQVLTQSGLQILRTYFNFGYGNYLGGGMVGQDYYNNGLSGGGWSQGGGTEYGGSEYIDQGTGRLGGYGSSGGIGGASGIGGSGGHNGGASGAGEGADSNGRDIGELDGQDGENADSADDDQ